MKYLKWVFKDSNKFDLGSFWFEFILSIMFFIFNIVLKSTFKLLLLSLILFWELLLLLEFKGFNINNYLLDTDEKFGEMRLNCHQRCEEEPGSEGCHYCETMFKLSNPDFIKKAKES